MKVVIFCGGLGTRIREASEALPKPLVSVGSRPILWQSCHCCGEQYRACGG